MSNSVSQKLVTIKELINQFKLEEALKLIKEIEQGKNLSHEEMLRTQVYKSRIYFYMGELDASFQITEDLYNKSQEFKNPLSTLDALFLKENFFYYPQPIEDFYKTLEQHSIRLLEPVKCWK